MQVGGAPGRRLIGLVVALTVFDFAASGRSSPSDLPSRALAPIALAFSSRSRRSASIAFVVQLPLTLLPIILDCELRWYVVTDRSLRIREGV